MKTNSRKSKRPSEAKTSRTANRKGDYVQRRVRGWQTYRETQRERDGQWLVLMRDGEIHLGTFYCGAFVQDGYCYNDTPGMISEITHVQKVNPPNS